MDSRRKMLLSHHLGIRKTACVCIIPKEERTTSTSLEIGKNFERERYGYNFNSLCVPCIYLVLVPVLSVLSRSTIPYTCTRFRVSSFSGQRERFSHLRWVHYHSFLDGNTKYSKIFVLKAILLVAIATTGNAAEVSIVKVRGGTLNSHQNWIFDDHTMIDPSLCTFLLNTNLFSSGSGQVSKDGGTIRSI